MEEPGLFDPLSLRRLTVKLFELLLSPEINSLTSLSVKPLEATPVEKDAYCGPSPLNGSGFGFVGGLLAAGVTERLSKTTPALTALPIDKSCDGSKKEIAKTYHSN
jgi:hypothetical protein